MCTNVYVRISAANDPADYARPVIIVTQSSHYIPAIRLVMRSYNRALRHGLSVS